MTLSTIHRTLIEKSRGKDIVDILGPNYETVLNFWHYVETISKEEFGAIEASYIENTDIFYNDEVSHRNLLTNFVNSISSIPEHDIWNTSFVYESRGTPFSAICAISWATHELIAMHELFNRGYKLLYVPMFQKS